MYFNLTVQQLPILIYFNFRGQLQPIRTLFCYLEIPFCEIHLENIDQQRKLLPPSIFAHLGKFKVDKAQLPALIHGDSMIKGQLPIMTYICRKFNRSELLGLNIQTRAKLQEILEIYFVKNNQTILQLLKLGDYAAEQRTQIQLEEACQKQLVTILNCSGYIKPICEYLYKQQSPRYILGQPTLLDFLFFQTCFFVLGCFGGPQQSYHERKHETACKKDGEGRQPPFYLKIMECYLESFKQEEFYSKHKMFLQGFTICSALTTESRRRGMKKFWLGDPKFIY